MMTRLTTELTPILGPNLINALAKYYTNTYDNLGCYNSFAWLGPR